MPVRTSLSQLGAGVSAVRKRAPESADNLRSQITRGGRLVDNNWRTGISTAMWILRPLRPGLSLGAVASVSQPLGPGPAATADSASQASAVSWSIPACGASTAAAPTLAASSWLP
jgi:hypothetical protein